MPFFPFSAYEPIIGKHNLDEIKVLAKEVKNKKIKHISSTALGGGVAEILHRLVPLLNDVGVETKWDVIKGGEDFFSVTKAFHNALQGRPTIISQRMYEVFYQYTEQNGREFDFSGDDVVIIHDPQPAGLVNFRSPIRNKWVWRCHIDLSKPEERVWNFLKGFILRYNACIFSVPAFAQNLLIPQFMIPPSIDPLSEKNRELKPEEINRVLEKYQIDPDRPIITQVSRFDHFKDPVGVIQAYHLAKKYVDCQLVLVGGGATDDPEWVTVLEEVKEAKGSNPDIFIITAPSEENDLVVNALQRASTIIVQKSLKEGFGLVVTEALWKKKPVIATAVGGIPLQIHHEITGILTHSIEGTAYYIRYLLAHPDIAKRLGETGHLHVFYNFLITAHLRRYLLLLIALDHPGKNIIYS